MQRGHTVGRMAVRWQMDRGRMYQAHRGGKSEVFQLTSSRVLDSETVRLGNVPDLIVHLVIGVFGEHGPKFATV